MTGLLEVEYAYTRFPAIVIGTWNKVSFEDFNESTASASKTTQDLFPLLKS